MLRKPVRKTSRSILDRYLSEIAETALLSVEEERALGKKIQEGDAEALHRLVEANLRFVVRIAKRYTNSGVPIQDLINEGNLGLIEAARRYDPTRDVRFISYAVWWIRRTIQTAISTIAHPMKLPVRVSILSRRIGGIISQTLRDRGRFPTSIEISEELEVDPAHLNIAMQTARQPISLNTPMGGDSETFLENMIAVTDKTEEDLVQQSVREQVRQAVGDLGYKEEYILKMRFGFEGQSPQTLKEIGDQMGLSRERVRQMEQRALERLRYHSKTRAAALGSFRSGALLSRATSPAT